MLGEFSMRDGSRLRTLARVVGANSPEFGISDPHPGSRGSFDVLFTFGPLCGPRGNTSGSCYRYPNGCASVVDQVNLTAGSVTTVLRGARSEKLIDAIPSPNGRLLAVAGGPCGAGGFDLTVHDLVSGQKWTLGADVSKCSPWVGADAAWSPDGRWLTFPYGPGSCHLGGIAGLVIAPADRTSTRRSWTVIQADRRCSFLYSVFDPQGIAAVEGCEYGQPADMHGNPQLGAAFLLQLSRSGHRVLQRLPLKLGFDGGAMAANPQTGTVLISESQAAGNGVRPYNWVWAYSHRTLRLIHRYNEADSARIIAAPW